MQDKHQTSPQKKDLSKFSKQFKSAIKPKDEQEKAGIDYLKLREKIGVYSNELSSKSEKQKEARDFVFARLGEEGIVNLYAGLSKYKVGYENLVLNNTLGIIGNKTINDKTINDRQFFREAFAEFIAKKNAFPGGEYNGDPNLRATNPEKAAISMEDFLGEEGMKLYQLALDEEMNSEEYMNAVFKASTTHFEGEKWKERPIVIVGGPSGCGKSYAAKAAVEKATEFLAKKDNDTSGNDVVAVDGGVAREVSQMRKLVIQAANNKGYPGIKDLHSQSKTLDKAKERMQKALLHPSTKVGVVIPETFSDIIKPFNKKKELLKLITSLPESKPIFCRVVGQDPATFQQIVAFMGSKRAWKTLGFERQVELDLNNTDLSESKAYGANGFKFGEKGSYIAEKLFKKLSKSNNCIIIFNDLVLKRPEPLDSQNWVDAKQGEPGTEKFSKQVFDEWKKNCKHTQSDPITLQKYNQLFASTLIKTSSEIDFAIAKDDFSKRIAAIKKNIAKDKEQDSGNPKVKQLEEICIQLDAIKTSLDLITKLDKEDAVKLKTQIKNNIETMEKNEDFSLLRQTEKGLNDIVNKLDKIVVEIPDNELEISESELEVLEEELLALDEENNPSTESYKALRAKYLSEREEYNSSLETELSPTPQAILVYS